MTTHTNPQGRTAGRDDHAGGEVVPAALPSAPSVPLEQRLMLTVAEVAELCGLKSPETVRKWITTGALRTIPHMRERRIARAELDRFLAEGVAA